MFWEPLDLPVDPPGTRVNAGLGTPLPADKPDEPDDTDPDDPDMDDDDDE